MNEFSEVLLKGVCISLSPEKGPTGRVERVRISTQAETWNGVRTLNQAFERDELERTGNPDEWILRTALDMAEIIDRPEAYVPRALELTDPERAVHQRAEEASRVLRIVENCPLTVDDVEIYARFCEQTALHGPGLIEFLRGAITAKQEGKF